MEAMRFSYTWINTQVCVTVSVCYNQSSPCLFIFYFSLHRPLAYFANNNGFDIAKVLVSNQKVHTYLAISVCKWSWFLVTQLEQLLLSM
jgi:hypothetical protein